MTFPHQINSPKRKWEYRSWRSLLANYKMSEILTPPELDTFVLVPAVLSCQTLRLQRARSLSLLASRKGRSGVTHFSEAVLGCSDHYRFFWLLIHCASSSSLLRPQDTQQCLVHSIVFVERVLKNLMGWQFCWPHLLLPLTSFSV